MTNPFFGYLERTWIDHQTDYGQHPDPCIGLPDDQIDDRITTWLAEFNPPMPPGSQMSAGIVAWIFHRYYR